MSRQQASDFPHFPQYLYPQSPYTRIGSDHCSYHYVHTEEGINKRRREGGVEKRRRKEKVTWIPPWLLWNLRLTAGQTRERGVLAKLYFSHSSAASFIELVLEPNMLLFVAQYLFGHFLVMIRIYIERWTLAPAVIGWRRPFSCAFPVTRPAYLLPITVWQTSIFRCIWHQSQSLRLSWSKLQHKSFRSHWSKLYHQCWSKLWWLILSCDQPYCHPINTWPTSIWLIWAFSLFPETICINVGDHIDWSCDESKPLTSILNTWQTSILFIILIRVVIDFKFPEPSRILENTLAKFWIQNIVPASLTFTGHVMAHINFSSVLPRAGVANMNIWL